MPKLKVNNNLGGNQIVYTNEDKHTNDTIQTYNVSANDISIDKLVKQVYDEWKGSKERELMLEGISYFKNESKISDKKRYDHCGLKGKQNDKLSNAKQRKNFMRKLTKQKANYLLGKPFSLETEDEKYLEILENDYFTKYFHRLSLNLGLESIKEGINWINVYYDEEGKLKFRRIPGNEVRPFWADREHTVLDQLIHFYDISVMDGDTSKICTYADYYYKKGVIHYVLDDKGFKRESESEVGEPNFIINKPKNKVDKKGEIIEDEYEVDSEGNLILEPQEMVWDILPWVPLKYNSDELSLIKFVKDSQDNYEKIISTAIDIFNDIPEVIKVIKGYSGEDLNQLIENIMEHRAVLVDEGGDVSSLETLFPVEALKEILSLIRKDVYEDGAGVDTQNTETGEKSGIALKFLYSDLDIDSDGMEQEFDVFIEWLLKFIDYDINQKYGKDYSEEEVNVSYNKSIMVNEKEQIENITASGGVKLPTDILLAKHPLVDDITQTKDLMLKQQEKEAEEMQKEMEQFGNIPINAALTSNNSTVVTEKDSSLNGSNNEQAGTQNSK